MSDKGSRFLCTLNNPFEHGVEDPAEWLERFYTQIKAVYLNGQLEKGADGTTHLQYYFTLKNPSRLSALKKVCPHSHFTTVKQDNGAMNYCLKEETRLQGPWEFGTKPLKRNDKTDWDEIKKLAVNNKLDDIPSDIFIRYNHALKSIAKDNMEVTDRTHEKKCYWYWGKSKVGKSFAAKTNFPGAYKKLCNKWWDQYKGHKSVILEDFDADHSRLAYHLKIWADPWYNFIGEIKNGALSIDIDNFVITSNYHPRDIWTKEQDLEPILRRFQVVHFESPLGGQGAKPPTLFGVSVDQAPAAGVEEAYHATQNWPHKL